MIRMEDSDVFWSVICVSFMIFISVIGCTEFAKILSNNPATQGIYFFILYILYFKCLFWFFNHVKEKEVSEDGTKNQKN